MRVWFSVTAVIAAFVVAEWFAANYDPELQFATLQQGDEWHNRAGNVRFTAESYVQPTSEAEIVRVVKEAVIATPVKIIRVVGAGHSFSPLVATPHILMNLDKYQALLHVDQLRSQATFQAGARIHHIHEQLKQHGLALPTAAAIVDQSIAGAISTGTHGSSKSYGGYPSLVAHLRLINGLGHVIEANATHNADVFSASRVGLGLTGIISTVTLRVVPLFVLRREESALLPLDDVLASFETDLEQHDHFLIYWLPYTNMARKVTLNRVQHSMRVAQSAFADWLRRIKYSLVSVLSIFLRMEARWPRLAPALHPIIANLLVETVTEDWSFESFNMRVPARYTLDIEYFVPRQHCVTSMRMTTELVTEYFSRQNTSTAMNGVVSMRFNTADDIWLSPFFDRDSCAIDVFQVHQSTDRGLIEAVDRLFLERFPGSRPHWGKMYNVSPRSLASALPRFHDFLRLRAQLDPHRLFVNPYLEEVLALASADPTIGDRGIKTGGSSCHYNPNLNAVGELHSAGISRDNTVEFHEGDDTESTPKPVFRVDFEIFGRVQGVYFRATTAQVAASLSLTGRVRNTVRGSVVGEAEGFAGDLARLKVFLCEIGSPGSEITRCDVSAARVLTSDQARRYMDFQVDYEDAD